MYRLDTRAEVLQDYVYDDDVIVTEAERVCVCCVQKSLLYIIQDRPRGSYNLVVLSRGV